MTTHDWISDVLNDLQVYCKKYDLDETLSLVQLTRRIFESENRANRPSTMTLEDHLRAVNSPVQ
jgi:hypothetical protein